MSNAWEAFTTLDQRLFLALNGWHGPWLDSLMDIITNKYTWIPMYLYLIVWAIRQHTIRVRVFSILITAIAAVGLADRLASGLLKPWIARPRPCHEPALSGLVHQVGGCGGAYGFVSSHAATSFALALVLSHLLGKANPLMYGLYLWALIYSYSRIYVGVHYPGDILGGTLVGLLSGTLLVWIYKMFSRKYYDNLL